MINKVSGQSCVQKPAIAPGKDGSSSTDRLEGRNENLKVEEEAFSRKGRQEPVGIRH